jgi:transposase
MPRVKCPEHGTVTVQMPWAMKHGRFTALFERLEIDVLQQSTNLFSESINNKVQRLIKKAYGCLNRIRYKTIIFFYCGGLNPYPRIIR